MEWEYIILKGIDKNDLIHLSENNMLISSPVDFLQLIFEPTWVIVFPSKQIAALPVGGSYPALQE